MIGILSFPRRRIGVQLALALVLASLAPLAGAGLLVSGLIETSLEREAQGTHDTLLAASRSLVDGHVRDSQAKLLTIAKMIVSEDYAVPLEDTKADMRNREDLARRLNALLTPSDTFLELGYYSYLRPVDQVGPGQNGDPENWAQRAQVQQEGYNNTRNLNKDNNFNPIPASNDAPRLPLNDPLARLPKSGQLYVCDTIQWSGPIPFIEMSVPVVSGERVIGVLVASVNLAPLRTVLSSLAAGKAVITLRDAAGTQLVSDGPVVEEAFETRGPRGERGWELSIRQPRGEAFATVTAARRQAWKWFGAAVALSLLLTAFFTARILPPVRALSLAAERMGRGDLTARSNVSRDDELGQLARAFDQMAESLEKLDQLKSDFVSHVSHELRTPLTSIKLSVANLQDGVVGPLDAKQLGVLGRVREDLDRLIRMVNELLDAARLEAGKVELAREACDFGAVATQAVETVRPLAERKSVRLVVECAAAPLTGDRAKLHEVVVNLVDNAVKFSPAGGEVRVAVRGVDGAAECVVEDRGPGIEPSKITRIFDKFSMVPGNGAPKPPGAGLGLSITRKIVELHGGTIRAENVADGGARFVVRISQSQGKT
ncbi:MAG: HAMP domain-containing histidine kinase [Planctomycetes bacterium]|nr:HAMP domain-containing histidine kinase [Planctomycetota bacterium]